ncbi:LbtU family siderophore porin [Alienimonas chondri]|nr:LbtU family siderophore porin [Alienimonas chondri]
MSFSPSPAYGGESIDTPGPIYVGDPTYAAGPMYGHGPTFVENHTYAPVVSGGLIAPPPLACETDHCGRGYGAFDGPPPDAFANALSVRLDTPHSAALLDFQNRQTDKQLLLLGSIPTVVPRPVLVPAAQMRLSGIAGRTNTPGKFGYLGRFPTDFTGTTATDLRILQANLAATAYFTPWVTGYVETLFSDVFSFPTFNQGSFQVRQAYAVFGNARKSPLYAFIGKKSVSYGDFGSLSPFSQAMPWHYFNALGEGGGVGYVKGGLHVVLTGLSGGRGVRTSDSPTKGKVNNYAVNASYAGCVGEFEYLVGAGYLDGTIYNAKTAEHIDVDASGPQNGAWDVNGTLRWRRATVAAEYVQTVKNWPVTDYEVSAWKAESAYDISALGRPLRLSTSYSVGKQAQDGLEFDRNAQLVLGAGWQVNPNALLSLEYVRSIGFAPLIALTAPTVSDRDVRQNSVVLGVSLVL